MPPRSSLSDADKRELARLMKIVNTQDNGFIPDEAYEDYYGIRPLAVVEVCLYDDKGRFVLKYRKDEHFVGWHFPGGSFRHTPEPFEATIRRHVCLDEVARDIEDPRVIAVHPYQAGEHPFGVPVIMLVACKPVGLVENDTCRWFEDAPPDIIQNAPPQITYVDVFKKWFKGDRNRYATIF